MRIRPLVHYCLPRRCDLARRRRRSQSSDPRTVPPAPPSPATSTWPTPTPPPASPPSCSNRRRHSTTIPILIRRKIAPRHWSIPPQSKPCSMAASRFPKSRPAPITSSLTRAVISHRFPPSRKTRSSTRRQKTTSVSLHPSPHRCARPGLPASVDVRLERGSAISGTVLFDDGSPASGLPVHALVRRKDGKKETWSPLRRHALRFDGGRLHRRSRPVSPHRSRNRASILFEVDLNLQHMDFAAAQARVAAPAALTTWPASPFYSGSATRKADAKPFKLSANEEHSGEDITIPTRQAAHRHRRDRRRARRARPESGQCRRCSTPTTKAKW